jgi:phenylglyoxylate dehydrogenase epsilon subunit
MPDTKYLIVGSSHAGLAALDAIRMVDSEGPITLLSKEDTLPYSPTVLPYVFSGMADSDRVFLRDASFFKEMGVDFLKGATAVELNAKDGKAVLDDGKVIGFEKALLATGARPQVPKIEGLSDCPFRVLRTLSDAMALKSGMDSARSAIILGAGLIGMHAAESLVEAGLQVTLVEMVNRVLPGYFDTKASGMIKNIFTDHGVKMLLGSPVTHVTSNHNGCGISLENGLDLSADLVLVATGVTPNWECLEKQGVDGSQGVLVDEFMRTELKNVWAAGDVTRSKSFFDGSPTYSGTLPMAVEQGRIAGASMAEDDGVKPFPGAIALNTYSFFGNRSFSVGQAMAMTSSKKNEVNISHLPSSNTYQKLVFSKNRLVGAMGINSDLDPGVIWRMVQNQVDLEGVKKVFAAQPKAIGRQLMTNLWR